MNSDQKVSSLSLVALACATLASALIAFDPLPRGLMPPPRPQSAVLLVTPAGAAEVKDPAMDRDFDMP